MICDREKLVSLVEKRPTIYDFNDKDHKNKIIQDNLWKEISNELDVNGNIF